jgi:hypothetical protein
MQNRNSPSPCTCTPYHCVCTLTPARVPSPLRVYPDPCACALTTACVPSGVERHTMSLFAIDCCFLQVLP